MSITPTEAELQTAIETMFRVRAVESPPDDQGGRTIWHRGHKGADLVTWVDAFGRVTRQELYLFGDCLVWEKAFGVRTGEAREPEGSNLTPYPGTIAFDPHANDDRIVRARKALEPYRGGDKFIAHARQLIGSELPAPVQPDEVKQIQAPRDEAQTRQSTGAAAKRIKMVALILGGILLGIAVMIGVLTLLS